MRSWCVAGTTMILMMNKGENDLLLLHKLFSHTIEDHLRIPLVYVLIPGGDPQGILRGSTIV